MSLIGTEHVAGNTIIYTLLIFAVGAILALGTLVITRNRKEALNRYFLALTLAIGGWIATNDIYAVTRDLNVKFEIALASYGFASLLAICFYLFSLSLVRQVYKEKKVTAYMLVAFGTCMGVVSIFPGAVASSIKGSSLVTSGAALGVYGLSILLLLVRCIYVWVKARQRYKQQDKTRMNVILLSFGSAAVVGLICNLVLPLAGTYSYVAIGPMGTLFFVAGTAYAIVKNQLFDIHLFVVRAAAYLTTLLFITFIFITPFVLITTRILGSYLTSAQLIFVVIASVCLLYVLQYLRRFFDRITTQIFFRNEYDPQTFLDELNQALVNQIELEKLLKTCAQIISKNMNTEFCLFGIKETGLKEVRVIGTVQKNFSLHDIVTARHTTPHLGSAVIIADYLPPEADEFKRLMNKNNVAALVRLVPEFASAKDGVEGLGYIVLGQKRSGNIYTPQDGRILGIIANELVIAIQNALRFEEIQRFNVTLQEEVDNATSKLRRTNRKLEELDNIKDDFISMASHQLRTPLTTVKGYLSMVLEGDAGKLTDQQKDMLQQAFVSSQRMVFLITDLLNVSRLKTGKFIMNPAPTDLSEMIQEEISQLQETLQVKNLQLTYNKPAHFPTLMLDEVKIRQVVMNFVDNAIYYTPAGGHIRVELDDKPSTIELRVIDDGIGVPKSEQHHLFTKFYRATNARKARPDGTGLGLFMAEKVIVASGGSAIFNSKEGQGSTFGFMFSKNKLAVPDDLPARTQTAETKLEAKSKSESVPARVTAKN